MADTSPHAFDQPESQHTSIWSVTWGEELQVIEPDPNAPPPSLRQRLKWRLAGWRYIAEDAAQAVLDFLEYKWLPIAMTLAAFAVGFILRGAW